MVNGEDGDVVIAINDTGVDWEHPDLKANVWTNAGEKAGNGRDKGVIEKKKKFLAKALNKLSKTLHA